MMGEFESSVAHLRGRNWKVPHERTRAQSQLVRMRSKKNTRDSIVSDACDGVRARQFPDEGHVCRFSSILATSARSAERAMDDRVAARSDHERPVTERWLH